MLIVLGFSDVFILPTNMFSVFKMPLHQEITTDTKVCHQRKKPWKYHIFKNYFRKVN